MATLLLIDGENFKGKIKDVFVAESKPKPAWYTYDFKKLLDGVLAGISVDRVVFYFARIKEHEDRKKKSHELIEEQRRLKTHLENQGFEVVFAGRVRGYLEKVTGSEQVLVFREKGVDVRIAVDMMASACDKSADTIVIASSDSDLQPAIKEVRARGSSCVYLGFENQPNKGLTFTTNRTILIRNAEVLACATPSVASKAV